MAKHKISTAVSHGVTLGTMGYGKTLHVLASGSVDNAAPGATAVYAAASFQSATVTNKGMIAGGNGTSLAYFGTAGGLGVDLAGGGMIRNGGEILGGDGGANGAGLHAMTKYYLIYTGGAGGDAVHIGNDGTLANVGFIAGGSGGDATYFGGEDVDVGGNGGAGVVLTRGGMIMNSGTIAGGLAGGIGAGKLNSFAQYGNDSGIGGTGILLQAGGTVVNHGMILGGDAVTASGFKYNHSMGEGRYSGGGTGLAAVAGGMISNFGTIEGGAGSPGYYSPSAGGNAVALYDNATLVNHGVIQGGHGGNIDAPPSARYINGPYAAGGGLGVFLAANGSVVNYGTINGGDASYGASGNNGAEGASGVYAKQNGTLVNAGVISGGIGSYGRSGMSPDGPNVTFGDGGTFINSGMIIAGQRADAVDFNSKIGGAITNSGTIMAGPGGKSALAVDGSGSPTMVTLHNTGLIAGGQGNGSHGIFNGFGLDALGCDVTNAGTITGGNATSATNYNPDGGIGIDIFFSGTVTNTSTGIVTGGTGSNSNTATVKSGTGGSGLLQDAGISGTNAGQLIGGAGGTMKIAGTASGMAGSGGVGLDLTGGILINTGTITGGAGGATSGSSESGTGGAGGAGVFLTDGTLVTSGIIAGGAGGAGFTTGTAGYAVQFGSGAATLEITGEAKFDGRVAGNSNTVDTLVLGGTAMSTLTGLGTEFTGFADLNTAGGSHWTLAATSLGSTDVSDSGSLVLANGISGSGTITIGHNATVSAMSGLSVAILAFSASGNGHLVLADPAGFTSTVAGFGAGDTIGLGSLDATGVDFANGTLSVLHGMTVIDTIAFAGDYTTSDFKVIGTLGDREIAATAAPADSLDTLRASHADIVWIAAHGGY